MIISSSSLIINKHCYELDMKSNFHESQRNDNIKMPSEKSTGMVFAGVAIVVGLFNTASPKVLTICLGIALVFAILSFFQPRVLTPLNILWFRLSIVMSRIVNPIVMAVLFGLVIIPAGLVMQIWYDPLRKRCGRKVETYWLENSDSGEQQSSMRNQF